MLLALDEARDQDRGAGTGVVWDEVKDGSLETAPSSSARLYASPGVLQMTTLVPGTKTKSPSLEFWLQIVFSFVCRLVPEVSIVLEGGVAGVGDMALMGAEGSGLAGSMGRVVLGSGEVLRRTGGGVSF